MKRLVICLVFGLLLACAVSAQSKSVTGTVTDYDASWKTITVNVGRLLPKGNYNANGSRSFVVFTVAVRGRGNKKCTSSVNYRAPKIVGNIKNTGRTVRIYYTRIDDEHGFGYILRATKIVEVR